MFKVKRPAIIGLLLVLLVFTGYLNHQLTQQALRKTSKEYKNYEALEKEKYGLEDNYAVEDNKNDFELVDVDSFDEEKINEVINTSNENIEEAMSKELHSGNRNYFVEYRLSRDKLRANLVERLEDIVNNSNTDEKVRTEAQTEIMKIGKLSEKELQIEGLVKSKGFDEALVFLTDNDIKVIVSSEDLNEQEMVKILEIVKSETEFDMNNIKIIKKQ